MNNNMLAGFERLVRETHKSEAELMTLAFRAGVCGNCGENGFWDAICGEKLDAMRPLKL